MFTGIVRELGEVVAVIPGSQGLRLELDAPHSAELTALGDSLSINGCCLTAVAREGSRLAFDAIPETLARTTLGRLTVGSRVNLEPALRAGEPLGGHYVQGHVDGVARLRERLDGSEGCRLRFEPPAALLRYIVEKGSITVEGVSLTVSALDAHGFEVALIPATLELTTLGRLGPGAEVNLEVDVLAKYVERLVGQR
jgi:riboflavin synthase